MIIADTHLFYRDDINLRGRLLENESLASYTSWRTGGKAEYLYFPADLTDLTLFLQSLPLSIPVTLLGLGSNTLIRDAGILGVVIITQGTLMNTTSLPSARENVFKIRAEAGVASAQLARYMARANLTGLEFMAGIPGTIGGALAMNAGCFGGETWQYVESVETINRTGSRIHRDRTEFQIAYRQVICPEGEWFVAGHFALMQGDKQQSLEQIRLLLERRNQTQPTGTANCGSVFRNPSGHYAGQLIEACGLKGTKIGGACVSSKHANFILNEGHATASDIENLIIHISAIVEQKTGVRLMPEVKIIGRSG